MTEHPEDAFDAFVGAGVTELLFHVEATRFPSRALQLLKRSDIGRGVAVNPASGGVDSDPPADIGPLQELERPRWEPRRLHVEKQLGHTRSDERVECVLRVLGHQVRTTWKTCCLLYT